MISNALQGWMIVIILHLGPVQPQMPMPMPMPMPMQAFPMPMPAPPPMSVNVHIPVPMPIPVPYRKKTTTTTTTTTTESTNGNGGNGDKDEYELMLPSPPFFPMPIPVPPPIFPMPTTRKSKNKCKCHCKNDHDNDCKDNRNDNCDDISLSHDCDIPHFSPECSDEKHKKPRKKHCHCQHSHSAIESCSKEHSSIISYDCSKNVERNRIKQRKRVKQRRFDVHRRRIGRLQGRRSRNSMINPVLTYISRNGQIKMRRRLSPDDAHALIDDDSLQDSDLEEFRKSRRSVVFRSQPRKSARSNRPTTILMRNGPHERGNGRKKVVFKPPENKKITNLSVSFQLTR